MNSEPTYAELVQIYGIPGRGQPPEEILRKLYAGDVASAFLLGVARSRSPRVNDLGYDVNQNRAASPVPPGTGGIVYDPNAPSNRAAFPYEGEGKPLYEDYVDQNRAANYVPGTGFQVYDPNAPSINRAASSYEGKPLYEDYVNQNRAANYVPGTGFQVYDPNSIDSAVNYAIDYVADTSRDIFATTGTNADYIPEISNQYPPDIISYEKELPYQKEVPYKKEVPYEKEAPYQKEVPYKKEVPYEKEVPYNLQNNNLLDDYNPVIAESVEQESEPFYITYIVPIIILSVLLIIGLILYFLYKNKRSTNLNVPIKQVLASFGKMLKF